MSKIALEVQGLDRLQRLATAFERRLTPANLTIQAMRVASMAGVLLHRATVQACVEAVYSSPSDYERTQDLLNAHEHIDDGLIQIVQIDPDAVPSAGSRSLNDAWYRERWVTRGREYVIDYAIPVHEGYVQWVFGRNTGVFHPGRFWMDRALTEAEEEILPFIAHAFALEVEAILRDAA